MDALLRWLHPELISPNQFISQLEEMGLMVEIGLWVLRTACERNVAWQKAGLPPVRVAVNLSSQQFYRSDIVGTAESVLRETGLSSKWLELEVTETLTRDNSETTIRIMRNLKRLGVSLSPDDFGTGWSSPSYLKSFQFDRIEIDQTFMRDIASQPAAETVVRNIINLGSNLGPHAWLKASKPAHSATIRAAAHPADALPALKLQSQLLREVRSEMDSAQRASILGIGRERSRSPGIPSQHRVLQEMCRKVKIQSAIRGFGFPFDTSFALTCDGFRSSRCSRSCRRNQSGFASDEAFGTPRGRHASFISAFLGRVTWLQGRGSILVPLQDRSLSAASILHSADGSTVKLCGSGRPGRKVAKTRFAAPGE